MKKNTLRDSFIKTLLVPGSPESVQSHGLPGALGSAGETAGQLMNLMAGLHQGAAAIFLSRYDALSHSSSSKGKVGLFKLVLALMCSFLVRLLTANVALKRDSPLRILDRYDANPPAAGTRRGVHDCPQLAGSAMYGKISRARLALSWPSLQVLGTTVRRRRKKTTLRPAR